MDNNQKPINLRINVKPIFTQLVHSNAYEGPCRVGNEKELSPDRERIKGKESFDRFQEDLKKNLIQEANILKPIYMEWGKDWIIPKKEFEKLEDDVDNVDLFLIASDLPQYPAVKIAQRYKKPLAIVGAVVNVDTSAYLRSRGLEGYAPLDFDELNHLVSLLKIRKAIRQTKILIVSDEELIPVGTVSSIWNLEDLNNRFGINYKRIPFEKFFNEMDANVQSKEVKEITNKLIKNAQRIHMKQDYVRQSVNFYIAARNLMKKYYCNAFTIPCFELCATQIPAKRKFTPCLTHTLLKDEGYPSSCEGDLSALLAIILLMYISKKSVYMGNSFYRGYFDKSHVINRKENILTLLHDVPGIKMKGLNGPELPYEIRNFTFGGWGVTLRYNFSKDKGEKVTLARFNPIGNKLLTTTGEIVGGGGFNEIGCSLRVYIKVPDITDFLHKEIDFGHHLAMAYGDYTQEIKEIADLIKFEVVEA